MSSPSPDLPPAAAPAADAPIDPAVLVAAIQHPFGAVGSGMPLLDRPLYGTTLFLARSTLDMRFGVFTAYTFQDLIHKDYIIALVHGDIATASELHIRLHSSCVTSETLRGCDCDCVQQLEGALRMIAAKGRGILFYLMQEGRGVGYIAKARDRMLVQASSDRISTFQAYHGMGLRKDHREYDNIAHICHLLGLRAEFILLTNNPDKVAALRAQGLQVVRSEPLEFEPSPFNHAYLAAKAAAGHSLRRPATAAAPASAPPEPVKLFRPHAVPEAQRFVYTASYWLPMKPVDGAIVLPDARFHELFPPGALEPLMAGGHPLVRECEPLRHDRHLVRIDTARLADHAARHPGGPVAALALTPYWFRVHVYFDLVTAQDYVVLTYGKPRPGDTPVVRIQSESLFNRFPLRAVHNRDRFEKSVALVVRHGSGVVMQLYFDGRGAGFGAFATDRMLTEAGVAASSDESYARLGVEYDSRDYDACMLLLHHHVCDEKIQMVMNSPSSLVRKKEYAAALARHRIDVEKWIFLDGDSAAD